MNYRKKRELIEKIAKRIEPKKQITCAEDAIKYIKNVYGYARKENFIVIIMNIKNKVIAIEKQEGDIQQLRVNMREVFKKIIENDGVNVIIMHNHPSGSTNPSDEDKTLTKNVKNGLNLINTKLLDHIIVAGNKELSFAKEGLC